MTDALGPAHVEFRLLGPLGITADGQPLALPGAAERALLALLLLSPGRMVTANTLIDRLWGEALPADPSNALQLRVSKLRRALAGTDAAVVRDGVGYRVDVAPESVDVEAFASGVRAARARRDSQDDGADGDAAGLYGAALARWGGEPLADFADQPWATVEAARLAQLRLAALTERAQLLLSLGRPADVVADLDPVVGADPTHETLAGLLMTALYQSGRQADALEVFSRTRAVLDDELGLEPSAALRALHQKVLAQDVSLAPVEEPQPAARPAQPSVEPPSGPCGRTCRRRSVRSSAASTSSGRCASCSPPRGWCRWSGPAAPGRRRPRTPRPPSSPTATRTARGWCGWRRSPTPTMCRWPPPRRSARRWTVPRSAVPPGSGCSPTWRTASCCSCWTTASTSSTPPPAWSTTCSRTARTSPCSPPPARRSRVPGEVQVPLGPLPTPPAGTPPAQVLSYPAAQLFAERARAVRPALDLTSDADLAAVADVVVALDGMPLAVELAAARASTLAPAELAARLTDRFGLLTSGARTADARQRTLRATVDWSHDLLTEPEQVVFRRLAVFHGGWTLDAAETVAAGPDVPRADVLDVLSRLVDRHMVTVDDVHPGQPSRYRMLETLRQYAVDKLGGAGEADQVAAAHVAYFRALTDAAEWTLRGPGQAATVRRLRDELPNLRAAFAWLAAGEQDAARVEDALHLAGSLGWFWHFGRHVEGRDVLRHVIALDGGSPARPRPGAASRVAGRTAPRVPGAPQPAVRRDRRGEPGPVRAARRHPPGRHLPGPAGRRRRLRTRGRREGDPFPGAARGRRRAVHRRRRRVGSRAGGVRPDGDLPQDR